MASLAETLLAQISGAAQASGQGSILGADQPAAQDGLAAAIPLLLTALSRNAESPEGAAALHKAIAEDHDGSVLDNLASYLQQPNLDDGDGILKHALGDQRDSAQLGISQTTGLDTNMVAQLLKMAAPLVLGMLAKQQQQKKLDADGLSNMLKNERAAEAENMPDMMGSITNMLDMNKDGSVMDDLQGLAGKFLGRREQ